MSQGELGDGELGTKGDIVEQSRSGRCWRRRGSLASPCTHVTTRSPRGTSTSLSLCFSNVGFFSFPLVSSGKPEQEELWQRLQHPPAPREQAVWDGEVGISVQEERWVRMSVTCPESSQLQMLLWAGRAPCSWETPELECPEVELVG